MFDRIEPLLPKVEKPTRYIDGEWGAIHDEESEFRVCLIYPDTYEIGLSNMGLAILYSAINSAEGMACERSYLPWVDMADLMRESEVPLLALESSCPVASFDVVGFTLAHEMACTNILEALDLSRIPVRASDRAEDDPIVLGGGPSVWNCEPMAPAFDAVLLGDGEEGIVDMCRCVKDGRSQGLSRSQILENLACVQGVYVPSLYDIVVGEGTTPWGVAVAREGSNAPAKVVKRVIPDLSATDPLPSGIVPFMHTVFDRQAIEVLRGCARGCRFCQAGITYRPVRERPQDQVVAACCKGLDRSGYDEVSLTSLSTTDHSECAQILHRLNASVAGKGVRVSIPSQRLDSFGVDMALEVAGDKRGGLTFAPEAGTQRLRDVINKNVTEGDLERAARNAFENGWRRMKLYFMMGLPTETDEDIVAIPAAAQRVLEIARDVIPKGQRGGVSVSISVAVFVPKAHTPFQWCGQLPIDEVRRRQRLLVESTHDRAIRVSYHDAETSLLEAFLSKGGRAVFDVIEDAWRSGCRFDAWSDHFRYDIWDAAATRHGYDIPAIASQGTPVGTRLPWEHTSPGVDPGFLEREWRRALDGITTQDCTRTSCVGCGVCPTLGVSNVIAGDRS
jgi:radical SAM family uncharacterized protein